MTGKLCTHDFQRLDEACRRVAIAYDFPYLVGSAGDDACDGFRDVDLRLILDDAEFDALCPTQARWELLSLSIGAYLRERTGLPIDFQLQRQTEANARFGDKPWNPMGGARVFAGGGDATPWTPERVKP